MHQAKIVVNSCYIKIPDERFKRSTPILASLDEAETIAFYTGKLGFAFCESNNGYLIFVRDGIHVHLFPCEDPDAGRNMGCYIYVTAIEQLYEEYKHLGLIHSNGGLRMMPWGLRQFAVADNNNNIFYFAGYKDSDGTASSTVEGQ